MTYRLVIGNKNTSSWSLRPWIALKQAGIPFGEICVNLRDPDVKAQILRYSPSGKVPALLANGEVIWDSLAILEYLADAHPEAGLWPKDPRARAMARSVSAEMHSGFAPLRQNCSMDFVARTPRADIDVATEADVRRIVALWRDCRRRFGTGGPFLFGGFCAADAMYAPVASRFRTYLPDLSAYGDDGTAQAYVDALFALPAMAEWEKGARAEAQAKG
ncbi:MAG: glutathione S-transferase family protein [Hyphomicrobiaceae bacterium]|nr:MAG: glutathione S-transferase family protein [Hyphomicrobiaceae bacterium]